jgi:hypothetical protein
MDFGRVGRDDGLVSSGWDGSIGFKAVPGLKATRNGEFAIFIREEQALTIASGHILSAAHSGATLSVPHHLRELARELGAETADAHAAAENNGSGETRHERKSKSGAFRHRFVVIILVGT